MSNSSRNGLRILVVDDHADSVRILTRLLAMHGHSVRGADGYAPALEAVQGEPFDLMLCDLGMPDHDGYELLAAVRGVRPIRAIAVTGHGMTSDVAKMTEAGFDDYFLKPYEFAKILVALDRVRGEIGAEQGEPPTDVALRARSASSRDQSAS